MDADYTYRFLQYQARKNQVSQISPQEYTFAVSSAQSKIYDWLIGQLEQYQFGKPVPRIALGMSAKVDTFLLPLKSTDVPVTVTANAAVYPANFNYLAAMTTSTGKNVAIIDDSKFNSRYNSSIDPITDPSTPPFGKRTATGWIIYPTTITQVLVTYYKRPPKTVWGYTVNSNGRAVYEPSTSTDPIFDDITMEKVLGLACKSLGLSFNAQDLVEYGKEIQLTGA